MPPRRKASRTAICARGVPRQRDDGGVGPDHHHPCRHRLLALAVLFQPGGKAERHPAGHRPLASGPSPETEPVHAKAAGLYMICTISKHEAEAKGYADAMMLDYRGYVAEATGANVFFVKDGELHTPTPDCFLNGLTRQSVIAIAKARGRSRWSSATSCRKRLSGFHRMLPHRLGRGSHAGVGDRALSLQARRADRNADERLCRRSARQGNRHAPSRAGLRPRRSAPRPPAAGRCRRLRARVVFCLKIKRLTPCANSTSTSARVRTLAAVASAKARNQNCDAAAPAKPASSDWAATARSKAAQRPAVEQQQPGQQQQGLQASAPPPAKRSRPARTGACSDRMAPR